MRIKNYYVDEPYNYINELIGEIIRNNISYVLLSGENHLELHFLDNIYRFYFKGEIQTMPENVSNDPFLDLLEDMADNIFNKKFIDNRKINIGYDDKKERHGFKKSA